MVASRIKKEANKYKKIFKLNKEVGMAQVQKKHKQKFAG